VHLYVYYEVTPDRAAMALERVRSMQLELAMANARVVQRDEEDRRVATWMEIYEDVPDDFEGRLAAAVERHGYAALTGARHVERFMDFD
jgi:hypothetical protein